MSYDFLKDFHRRMDIVAIIEFIVKKINRKSTFKEFGFDDNESINLVMLVLCFIMEKSLLEEPCTREDISVYLRTLDVDYFNKEISDEDYPKLANYIVRDCLQNSGTPYYFTTHDYALNQKKEVNVKLIDDKRISRGNEKFFSYYLTPQGYKFLFNTLEIEEAMQVSIEQFKLTLAIQKRNFSSAKTNVDNLLNLCKTQIHKINYFIKRVREDISTAGLEEYETIYNDTFATISEQTEGYQNLYEVIESTERALLAEDISKENLSGEIESIWYIKEKLTFIITEQTSLLLKQQELQKIYNDAIDNILFIGFENRLNIEEDIIKKVDENPNHMYKTIPILRPLFMPQVYKIFNINKALSEQKIATLEDEDINKNVLIDERYLATGESENQRRIKQMNGYYMDIMDVFFKFILNSQDGKVHLKEIVDTLKVQGQAEYQRIVPNVRVLMNVLLQLCSIKSVSVSGIMESRNRTIFNPSEEFDIKYCVLELVNRNKDYARILNFDVMLSRKKSFTIQERIDKPDNDDFSIGTVEQLVCPEIVFTAEVNK